MIAIDPPLVPATRLGRILRERRLESGRTLQQVAFHLGPHLDAAVLDAVESGVRDLSDPELVQVANAYGIDAHRMVPTRTELVIDLEGGTISVGDGRRATVADAGQVLERYLSLVYSLRGVDVGTTFALRDQDIDVLAQTLDSSVRDIAVRLTNLQQQPERVAPLVKRMRRRLIVPAAGILVASVGVGALIMVGTDEPAVPVSIGSAAALTRVVVPDVELIPAVVVERASVEGPAVVQEPGT